MNPTCGEKSSNGGGRPLWKKTAPSIGKRWESGYLPNRMLCDGWRELIHPRVLRERLGGSSRKYRADPDVVAVVDDTPLLIEEGLDEDCDAIVFVDATVENRIHRVAAARGGTADELTRRQENQMPLDMKAKRADYVVENNASGADCESHVRRVLSQILNDRIA